MPRRNPSLITGEIYHVFNRGVEKRDVFLNEADYKHFLETLEHYRNTAPKLSRKSKNRLRKQSDEGLVEVLCYCLMPNHFHLLIKQVKDKGISTFIGKAANSFTKYFNTKNDRVGPLFQGTFKAVRIENDEQLLHVSRYIHLNPLMSGLAGELKDYKWSSYPRYIGEEDSDLVGNQEVLSHFSSNKGYEKFVLDQVEYAKSLEQLKHHLLD